MAHEAYHNESVFIINWFAVVASFDTQCIVSNFESERYISRVGRASTVFTRPTTLSGPGYLTKISKTRIVKLR